MRSAVYTLRNSLSITAKQTAAAKIATVILELPIFKTSKFIATYLAFNNEVDTQILIDSIWQQQKICYLPLVDKPNAFQNLARRKTEGRVTSDQMLFIRYEKNDQLIKNRFGILEPLFNAKKIIKPEELDLVIMPLVGFDEKANRLGTGGGFYDRTFDFKKQKLQVLPYLIGIAYELQKLRTIVPMDWDVPMDMVVTESGVKF